MSGKLFYISILIMLMTGCTGAAQPATELTVEASDFAFTPASITVPAGQPITIQLRNVGKIEHDFVVDRISVSGVETSDSGPAAHHQMNQPEFDLHFFAAAGDTAVLKFTPLEPGTYEVFCSIEGHREAGMTGQLLVLEAEG